MRNVFRHCGMGGNTNEIETCVRLGGSDSIAGAVDAHNSLHTFEDCHFANYGDKALVLDDTQVYSVVLKNVLCQPAGWRESSTGAMTSGSAMLTHNAGIAAKDVGKWVEVDGAGAGGTLLHAQVVSITDATHCVLDTAASTTVGPTATVRTGPQFGIYARKGSFLAYGGGVGNHLGYDYYCGGPAGPYLIEGAVCWTSRGFLLTSGPAGQAIQPITIRNTRFTGDAVLAEYPQAVQFLWGGTLLVENSTIGDPYNQRQLKLVLGLGSGDGSPERHSATFINTHVDSTFATADVFVTNTPTFVGDCKHTSSPADNGVTLLGERPRNAASFTGAAVHGAQTLDFGWGRTISVRLDGATTFTFTHLRHGLGTPQRLLVTHVGGPWPVTWPTVKWARGEAPTHAGANVTDMFEFLYDGTNIYGRILGESFS
jgi:hypothetical protein